MARGFALAASSAGDRAARRAAAGLSADAGFLRAAARHLAALTMAARRRTLARWIRRSGALEVARARLPVQRVNGSQPHPRALAILHGPAVGARLQWRPGYTPEPELQLLLLSIARTEAGPWRA